MLFLIQPRRQYEYHRCDEEPDNRDPSEGHREAFEVEGTLLEGAAGDSESEEDGDRVGYLVADGRDTRDCFEGRRADQWQEAQEDVHEEDQEDYAVRALSLRVDFV